MNEFKSFKQNSKLISIEHNGMNNRVRKHFEDLEYLYNSDILYFFITFQCY